MLKEKGLCAAWGVWKYAKEIGMIENTKNAIEKARGSGIPIIYLKMDMKPQLLQEIGFLKEVKESIFNKISPKQRELHMKIVKELAPHPEDYIVTNNTMDGFHNTDLEEILKGLKCKTLIFTGVVTNLCVENTVRSAFNRGYNSIVLNDCVATMNEQYQKFPIDEIFPMLGEVTTVEKLEITS